MLKTETNTRRMGMRVLLAAKEVLGKRRTFSVDFEHGQWWVTDRSTRAQWSAVDAEGGRSAYGFDFEQVTEDNA